MAKVMRAIDLDWLNCNHIFMAKKNPVPETERLLDKKIIGIINDYIKKNSDLRFPVTYCLSPEEIRNKMDTFLQEEGCTHEELYRHIEDYLEYSVKTGHRQYFNQLWSGFSLPGFLGDIITSLTNTSMYTYDVAPVASTLETDLIEKMGKAVGFRDPDGIFVTGGSNGNLIAMLIARNLKFPDVRTHGFPNNTRLKAFVSDQAHYSFEKAANIIGVGGDNIHKIPSDERGRMIPQKLEEEIERQTKNNNQPFFIGATAGTTVKGAFDPLEEISVISKRHDLWMHVDGSFGGSVILSPKHSRLLKGCEDADSYIWNPHKMMGVPLVCSALLVKKKGLLQQTFTASGTEYLFHDNDFAAFDLGPKSMQCGRRVDAFKLWLSWKYYGDRGYADRMDRFFDLASYAEEIVKSHPRLELMAPRSSVTVCFRFVPDSASDINRFNISLRQELARSGKSFVNYGYIGGDVAIRLVILNHEAREGDITQFFQYFVETGERLDIC
jgi:glutamate/tyrosine decarboxylase-like PLP-dependent enzyme